MIAAFVGAVAIVGLAEESDGNSGEITHMLSRLGVVVLLSHDYLPPTTHGPTVWNFLGHPQRGRRTMAGRAVLQERERSVCRCSDKLRTTL